MLGLDAWHLWIIAAVILLIAEIFTPGFVLACFGVGGLVASLSAALGLGYNGQVVLFIATSIATFFTVRPFYLKHMAADGPGLKTNKDALIGKHARVIETIVPLEGRGRVAVGGEDWAAVSSDETVEEAQEIMEGVTVHVIGVDGSRLVVTAGQENAETLN
jgi:membrane protein implicated in regulation of membrane protease activity